MPKTVKFKIICQSSGLNLVSKVGEGMYEGSARANKPRMGGFSSLPRHKEAF